MLLLNKRELNKWKNTRLKATIVHQMVLRRLNIHMQKKEDGSYLILHVILSQNRSKFCVQELDCTPQDITWVNGHLTQSRH